jgi:methyl-coenzyme M reductase beta subunit
MARYSDKVDLYDDRGNLLARDTPIEAISPLKNAAIGKIVGIVQRTMAVNLEGIEKALKTGAVGGAGMIIRGRELDLDIVGKAEEIRKEVEEILRVEEGDDTNVEIVGGGKRLLVQVPTLRFKAEYSVGVTATAAAVTQAIIDVCAVDMFNADMVKAAVWGCYPQTVDMPGSNIRSILEIPQKNEGLGYSLRNIMVNHMVAVAKKKAMNAVALSAIF